MTAEQPSGTNRRSKSTIQVREELVFTPQQDGDDTFSIIEDPVNSKFYRIGKRETAFITLLQRFRTIKAALRASQSQQLEVTPDEAKAIVDWLASQGLLKTKTKRPSRRANSRIINPLFLRIPLWTPDRFFAQANRLFGWLTSLPAFIVWIIVCFAACHQLVHNWSRIIGYAQHVFRLDNWALLAIAWVALKLVHELAHGLVCKMYGGSVRESGLVLAFFTPLAYVDVSSAWRFPSKWMRIFTSSAGMYAELFVAGLAAIIWSNTQTGILNDLCFNVITMAGLATILFNANPLMKFDGYYILADLLGIQNLYGRGQQFVGQSLGRLMLGPTSTSVLQNTYGPPSSRCKDTLIAVYGVLALLWRIVVCVSLTLAAAVMFHGAGVVLAAIAILVWTRPLLAQTSRFLISGQLRSPRVAFRFALALMALATMTALLWFSIPAPNSVTAPTVVRFSPATVIRADADGFVHEIKVTDGQHVKAGQLLAVLVNDELQLSFAKLVIQVQQSQLRCRRFRNKGELARLQSEQEQLRVLEEKVSKTQRRLDGLRLTAPVSGVVCSPQLKSAQGRFVSAGDEVMTIGSENSKELLVSVAERDLDRFLEQVGRAAQVRLKSGQVFHCSLDAVKPSASRRPPHPSLCSDAGGPLLVENGERPELLAPRFRVTATMTSATARTLQAGCTGVVSLQIPRQPLGQLAYDFVARWLREFGVQR